MLSTLSWPSVPLHLGRKAHFKGHQDFLPQVPRTVTVHAQSSGTAASQTFEYSISTSYSYDKPRLEQSLTAQKGVRSSVDHIAPSTGPMPGKSLTANFVAEHTAQERKNEMNKKAFKIYADLKVPNTFIYERSEGSRSDTMTSYSSVSSDSSASSTSTTSTTSTISPPNTNFLPDKANANTSYQHLSRGNHMQTRPISFIGNPTTMPREDTRLSVIEPPPITQSDGHMRSVPESTLHFPIVQARDGYSSDTVVMNQGVHRERASVRPASSLSARETTPPRIDEQVPRTRRLSTTGSGVHPLPLIRDRHSPNHALSRSESIRSVTSNIHTPPTAVPRRAPSIERAHVSPVRERLRDSPPTAAEHPRHRRLSNASMHGPPVTYPIDRTPSSRGSVAASMSRERSSPTSPHSPGDMIRSHAHQSPPNGLLLQHDRPLDVTGRTIAEHRGRSPPSNIIITSGADVIQPSRSVRFTENLVCPSPIPPSRRRKGWYNKRGDQLWTNDGQFSVTDQPYPPDLDDYPDFGIGWMNEEGIRIDMNHRLIPKGPLRPALKRCSTSSSSGGSSNHSHRPESRAIYPGLKIRAIDE